MNAATTIPSDYSEVIDGIYYKQICGIWYCWSVKNQDWYISRVVNGWL